jgi:hypothetical protein
MDLRFFPSQKHARVGVLEPIDPNRAGACAAPHGGAVADKLTALQEALGRGGGTGEAAVKPGRTQPSLIAILHAMSS